MNTLRFLEIKEKRCTESAIPKYIEQNNWLDDLWLDNAMRCTVIQVGSNKKQNLIQSWVEFKIDHPLSH